MTVKKDNPKSKLYVLVVDNPGYGLNLPDEDSRVVLQTALRNCTLKAVQFRRKSNL